jgi:hypothetical protein
MATLKTYEILIADEWWCKARGTTLGMEEGWLSWTDGESQGFSRPGNWRPGNWRKIAMARMENKPSEVVSE